MGENDKLGKDELQETGQTSKEKDESTSEETYTKKQLEKFISDAKSEMGRKNTEVIRERDSLKEEVANIKSEREALQEQVDEMAKDDPAKGDYLTLIKNLKAKENQLKADKRAEDERIQANSERIMKAEKTLRKENIQTIAAEYEDGDAKRLLGMCDVTEAVTEEQIRKVAENLFSNKKSSENPTEKVKVYSGQTIGGSVSSEETMLKKRYPTMY